jgi:hypothetical protein
VTDFEERHSLGAAVDQLWPRIDSGEASLEEVRALALKVFDRLGVSGLDRWEKHHFIWVLKGLATSREQPGAGLYTALHGVEQALAPADARVTPDDPQLDEISENDLRQWVAAA